MHIEVLERPFAPDLVKTRPGNFGQELSYIEAVHVIRRLNEGFDYNWNFEIVTHVVEEREVFVVGKLTAGGITKMAFGSSEVTRRRDTGEVVSLGSDLKSASTDAMKKAASLFGIALSLYESDPASKTAAKVPGNGNGSSKGNGNGSHHSGGNGNGVGHDQSAGNGNGRLTSRQLGAILGIARDRGLDRTAINSMSLERFGKNVEFIHKTDASSLIQELQELPV